MITKCGPNCEVCNFYQLNACLRLPHWGSKSPWTLLPNLLKISRHLSFFVPRSVSEIKVYKCVLDINILYKKRNTKFCFRRWTSNNYMHIRTHLVQWKGYGMGNRGIMAGSPIGVTDSSYSLNSQYNPGVHQPRIQWVVTGHSQGIKWLGAQDDRSFLSWTRRCHV